MARSVLQPSSLLVLAAVVGAAGCGGHGDELARATNCLRDQHAHPHAVPAQVSHSLGESGWRVRTFDLGGNGLVVVAAKNEAGARQARRRVAQAISTVSAHKPQPHQRGSLVWVWDEQPSPSARAVVRRCIG